MKPKPDIIRELPECPPHLGEVGRAKWDEIVALMDRMGCLSKSDGDLVAMYCSTFGDWMKAREIVEAEGLLVISPKGFPMPHPALCIARKAEERCHKLLLDMGLTPSARSKVDVIAPEDEAASRWGDLLA